MESKVERFVKHATFTIERTYAANPEKVYRAWSDPVAKAKWFSKADEFDFRVGGREYSSGGPPEGPVFTFDACYQEIVPEQRIVYTYTLDMNETRISVSTTTVEFAPAAGGTKLTFTEQAAFFDGHDTPEIREHGTGEMLDALGKLMEEADGRTAPKVEGKGITNQREYNFTQQQLFAAWTNPKLLARWWGPNGFTNTYHEFDLRQGADWRYTMHGPNGVDYPNHMKLVEITPSEKIILDHQGSPEFRLTATFDDLGGGRTRLTFDQQFAKAEEFVEAVKYCVEANEQNLDRLGALLIETAGVQ
ncbi:MAG: Activator of Hsp90 ATPase 1 family protein [Paenibacillaceae bacterium]|jgi:uncharacterized protein YndB with AHSA1/START domain|nr:Activator of Hsp90 ATPase 1 family protein [Paenibacillaceae bacterium]